MATGTATLISPLDRQILEAGIGQVKFIDCELKIQNYRCRHCLLVAVNPFFNYNCEHLLCRECFENETTNGCPVCRGSVTNMYKDPVFEKEMLELKVYCAFKNRWCDEVVPLHDYHRHKFRCQANAGTEVADIDHKKLIDYLLTAEERLQTLVERLQEESEAKHKLEVRVQDLEERLKKEREMNKIEITLMQDQLREARLKEEPKACPPCQNCTHPFVA